MKLSDELTFTASSRRAQANVVVPLLAAAAAACLGMCQCSSFWGQKPGRGWFNRPVAPMAIPARPQGV